MEVDFRMGKYVVSFNSLEDRASFECLISQMGAGWSLSTIDNLRGAWLLITPHKSSAAEHLVGFFTEKGIINDYRETSA